MKTEEKKSVSGYEITARLFIKVDPNDHTAMAGASKRVAALKTLDWKTLGETEAAPEIEVDKITSRFVARRSTEK